LIDASVFGPVHDDETNDLVPITAGGWIGLFS